MALQQRTNQGLRELALFAGAGGGILGGKLLGWRTVCAVEINTFCARRLMQRQNEGHLSHFPIWDDVRTFDGRPWQGLVDVVSGGFPCQDISCAGKGAGIEGERSGLWTELARIIGEVRPRYAFVENSPILTVRGLGKVLGDLAEMGFSAKWGTLSASEIGAPHTRERIFILADSRSKPKYSTIQPKDSPKLGRSKEVRCKDWEFFEMVAGVPTGFGKWREMGEPGLVGNNDGLAETMDRIGAIGNGQVPAVVKLAWKILSGD